MLNNMSVELHTLEVGLLTTDCEFSKAGVDWKFACDPSQLCLGSHPVLESKQGKVIQPSHQYKGLPRACKMFCGLL